MPVNLHLTVEEDPFARGRELGRRWRHQIRETLSDYAWLFAAAGLSEVSVRAIAEDCHEALLAWSPQLALETEGVASGCGLEVWQAAALNARTEIVTRGRIAGLKECTTAAWLPPNGGPHAIQTWDWIPRVHTFMVRRHRSPAGLGVVAFAENGVLAKIGVNSARFGLLLALLCHTSDGTRAGVPVHALARQLLDSATSVAEAVEMTVSVPLAASAALTLLEYDGQHASGVVLELCPAGSAVHQAQDGYLLHTNHFLDPALAEGDRLAAIGDDTLPRMARLTQLRDVLRTDDRTARAKGLVSHWADGAPICAHPRSGASDTDRWETKMTFSLDLNAASLGFQEGGPCRLTEAGWQDVAA